MYAFAIQVANDDAKWTKFAEDLTAIDQDLGDLFEQKVEDNEWESELTEISKLETLEKLNLLFKTVLGI